MRRKFIHPAVATGAAVAVTVMMTAAAAGSAPHASGGPRTTTPIKHVVVIIGENHTFDNIFATYQPPAGQTIWNLRSEGIVTANGTPGPDFAKATQLTASNTKAYTLTPKITGTYKTLPQPNTTYVATGCSGLPANSPDTRFPATLPDGPYQITRYAPYLDDHSQYTGGCEFTGAFTGDPIHRFYQMWQQYDEGRPDQQVWTANTAGDDNGAATPAPIFQGSNSMGFYNVQQGDAPLLTALANSYSMSDNYHQAQMGGTGVEHVVLGTADYPYYNDGNGKPVPPPANQVENPNPRPGTNNSFTSDGYAGGSYTNCSDPSAPGVPAIMEYLRDQRFRPFNGGDCAPGAYYLLNNYNPAYNADGSLVNTTTSPFTISPQTVPTIAEELSARGISWGYFGQGLTDTDQQLDTYCNICNPFQYSKAIMTGPLRQNIKGFQAFEAAAKSGTLPAVSFVKPDGNYDGHPASSTLPAFEAFTRQAIEDVASNPAQWASTAIFVTMDEGGGYYDSGYIQPFTFFGDGPRIPMIAVSPWAKQGAVEHGYDDHVSIVKFIEANWRLDELSRRSLDNLPNPIASERDPYVPVNGPALGNLMDQFDFRAAPHLALPALPSNGIAVNPLS
jgi:acid phosphatase